MSVAKRAQVTDGECMSNRLLRTLLAAAVATAAFAVGAPAANAELLVASAENCSPQTTTKAFAAWGDTLDYQLAPGGSFEVRDEAWSLDRASLVAENEPWKVHAASDKRSVKLPPGASATSPVMCVGIHEPVVRFFARNNTALLSTLSVEATI